jgi:signal transduction histidine kinase
MLHEFLTENRNELAKRCHAKVVARLASAAPPIVPARGSAHGVPRLIEQLIETLRAGGEPITLVPGIGESAAHHAGELHRSGFTIKQVVHTYGDLCQALTELAHERDEPITVAEFHTFNRCLDNAIADAVTEFSRARHHDTAEASALTTNERLTVLAHELEDQLNAAALAFQAIRSGSVAIAGATGTLLERSLRKMRDLIERSLTDARDAGPPIQREPIAIDELVSEVLVAVAVEATTRGLSFSSEIEPGLIIVGDRAMLASALATLLHNAVKFTRPRGTIVLSARVVADRIAIGVSDGCGGLAPTVMERMFRPFARLGAAHADLGLGLSISRRAVEACGGKLEVRNLPGIGCIVTIDLPRSSAI